MSRQQTLGRTVILSIDPMGWKMNVENIAVPTMRFAGVAD